jgi:hypothetical protein
MSKRKGKTASKGSVKRRTLNANNVPRTAGGQPASRGTEGQQAQDPKRRLGQFSGTGEAHASLKGTRGKGHRATSK